ncbi:MAG: hypothetical protein QM786_02325 [Breznakibacter sp.]
MDSQKSFFKQHYLLWIVIGILAFSLAYLIYHNKAKEEEYGGTIDEIALEKAIIARDFQELALDYDTLQTNNEEMSRQLDKERERVGQLIEELRNLKASNTAQIAQYKKELATLRNVMRNFVLQIDSLNARNKALTNENVVVKKQIAEIKDSNKELAKQNEELSQKVEIAAKLEIRDMMGQGLNNKGKETNRISRIEKVRICFTLLKNVTAKVGEKSVYLRLMRPDGALLLHSANDVFLFEGSKINYSATRVIEYGGNDLDVCLFYNAEEGELIGGAYTADVFVDGSNIGTVKFELK